MLKGMNLVLLDLRREMTPKGAMTFKEAYRGCYLRRSCVFVHVFGPKM